MAGTASLKFDINHLEKGISKMDDRLDAAVYMLLSTKSKQLETYAKQNAPWTDRSGQARRSIKGDVERFGTNKYRIALSINVDYGIWLEFAHEERFAIIIPTIEQKGPEVINAFSMLMQKL